MLKQRRKISNVGRSPGWWCQGMGIWWLRYERQTKDECNEDYYWAGAQNIKFRKINQHSRVGAHEFENKNKHGYFWEKYLFMMKATTISCSAFFSLYKLRLKICTLLVKSSIKMPSVQLSLTIFLPTFSSSRVLPQITKNFDKKN